MNWRALKPADVKACLPILLSKKGDGIVGREIAFEIWKQLADELSFISAVVERDKFNHNQIVGFGAAIFTSPEFADKEIETPRPDINSRVVEGLARGRRVLATRGEIAEANATAGIDVIIMGGMWLDGILTPDERHEVQVLLVRSFTECLAGYRIRRVIQETADSATDQHLQHSPEFRVLAKFPEYDRVIYMMTADSVRQLPGSLGNVIFGYRRPALRLRESHQQLLRNAIQGATDLELAKALRLSSDAVKARWRSIYSQIQELMPDLISSHAENSRGSQKRHLVIEFVRGHPEELRPYKF